METNKESSNFEDLAKSLKVNSNVIPGLTNTAILTDCLCTTCKS